MDNLGLKVENIVSKGETARFVQFLLFSQCFQKAVCCRGVRNRLYEGKGWLRAFEMKAMPLLFEQYT